MGDDLAARIARPAGDLVTANPILVSVDQPARRVAQQLLERSAAAAFVVAPDGRALGIASAADLEWRLAARGDDPPIATVMQGPIALCPATSAAVTVAAQLRRDGRAALGVIDAAGHPLGVVDAALAAGFDAEVLAAAPRGDRADRAAAKVAQQPLVQVLLARGAEPVDVLRVLAALDRLHVAAAFDQSTGALRAAGWGEPPVAFSVIVMGSIGRGECLLQPDQDNGLILADYPDAAHGEVDDYFIALAERAVEDMAETGFARCDGGVMASNPLWRKTLPQWLAQIAGWVRRGSPQRNLAADIFFDFRQVSGDALLAESLRTAALAAVQAAPVFLLGLAWRQIELGSPLTPLGGIETDADGLVDLKLWGSAPITELTRALALRQGVAASGTLERLGRLATLGALAGEFVTELDRDFRWLAGLRLRAELEALQRGAGSGRKLRPEALAASERERLVRLLRDVDRYRGAVRRSLLGAA